MKQLIEMIDLHSRKMRENARFIAKQKLLLQNKIVMSPTVMLGCAFLIGIFISPTKLISNVFKTSLTTFIPASGQITRYLHELLAANLRK